MKVILLKKEFDIFEKIAAVTLLPSYTKSKPLGAKYLLWIRKTFLD